MTPPPADAPPSAPEQEQPPVTQGEKRLIMTALMISVALAALDVMVVSTALPTIVAQLNGVSHYSWLIAIYLLTSTTSVPLYGQLADNLGRKPILVFGIVLFIGSSLLCAQSRTMTQLIIFRAVQGLGAGAILPMTMTIIGDLFSIEERARYQGMFSGVWGVSSIVGPALGAAILTVWSWHGIFYVNLPVGLIALTLVLKHYHERKVSQHRSVDIWGAVLMTAGVSALMLALQRKSSELGESMMLYGIGIAALLLLFPVEKRMARPLLPVTLLRRRIIITSYLVGFLGGILQFGTSSFMPLFVQGAMSGTPASVGAVMAPVAVGWPLGSVLSGRLILSMGYKRVLALGMTIGVLGAASLQLLNAHIPLPAVMCVVAFIGLALGLTATPVIIAVQNAVEWNQRGIATALNQFSRTIGGVIGVALMGTMLNVRLGGYLERSSLTAGNNPADLVRDLLDPARRGNYGADVLTAVRGDLAAALHSVYLLPLLAAGAALMVILFIYPGGGVEKHKR